MCSVQYMVQSTYKSSVHTRGIHSCCMYGGNTTTVGIQKDEKRYTLLGETSSLLVLFISEIAACAASSTVDITIFGLFQRESR